MEFQTNPIPSQQTDPTIRREPLQSLMRMKFRNIFENDEIHRQMIYSLLKIFWNHNSNRIEVNRTFENRSFDGEFRNYFGIITQAELKSIELLRINRLTVNLILTKFAIKRL